MVFCQWVVTHCPSHPVGVSQSQSEWMSLLVTTRHKADRSDLLGHRSIGRPLRESLFEWLGTVATAVALNRAELNLCITYLQHASFVLHCLPQSHTYEHGRLNECASLAIFFIKMVSTHMQIADHNEEKGFAPGLLYYSRRPCFVGCGGTFYVSFTSFRGEARRRHRHRLNFTCSLFISLCDT